MEGVALGVVLKADQGDDNADQHKLNIADGGVLTLQSKISGGFVTYLTHTPNATVADSTTAVAGNLTVAGDLTLGSGAVINEAELEAIDGITAGTVAASKAVIVDSNKDIASFRNVTLTGELDAGSLDISGDADIDGTLEADAMTLNGTAITATATLDTGISNNNVPKFTSGVADNDFLRVDGTAIEGRSASEVLSDIAALPLAGGSMTGGVTITTADNSAQLTLKSTDADSSVGPVLDLVRDSASPADGDAIGQIKHTADNDAGEATTYASSFVTLRDATDGVEDGQIIQYVMSSGALVDHLRMGKSSAGGQSEVVVNEGSVDIDFRVEGNGNANAFFVQGSDDFIGIGTGTPKKKLHIQDTTSDGMIILDRNGTSTDHQICFAHNYQSGGQSGGNYYAIGVDDSENKLVFAFDANSQASLSADAKMTMNSSGDVTTAGGVSATGEITTTNSLSQNSNSIRTAIGNDGGSGTFGTSTNHALKLFTNNNHMATLTNNGDILIGKTSTSASTDGIRLTAASGNASNFSINAGTPMQINRNGDDGGLINFLQAGSLEGGISVSGSTVSYTGGHLSRWSQAADGNRIDGLVKGTVMTNLDQMAKWHHEAKAATLYEDDDEIPEGKKVGDQKTPAVDAYDEDNEQLNCMAVSSVEGDANVAGVFVNWDEDDKDHTNDMVVAMTGDMVIRIAQGTTVARGDLLMSAGDGTAKPQGDDIVRSKTIAKVTSTNKSHTYDDGSYLVPCVLMAC